MHAQWVAINNKHPIQTTELSSSIHLHPFSCSTGVTIMPQMDEPYYTSEQINIPPELPDILKQFTKAAIRTQPNDVLAWSSAYFQALANNEIPPVKERLEMPMTIQKTGTSLTPGLLRVLNKQLGPKKNVPLGLVEQKWLDVALPKEQFDELVLTGSFSDGEGDVEWIKFFAVACTSLAPNITGAMRIVCDILTADPEGGASRIPFPLFKYIYRFLAEVDGDIDGEHVDTVVECLQQHVDKQEGFVQPRNFVDAGGPPLRPEA